MSIDGQRRSEIILEYFDLLKWNKNGCKVDILAETLNSNEQLQFIEQDLIKIQDSIIEKRNIASFAQEEIDKIQPVISSTEESLLRLKEKVLLARKERLQCIETTPQSEFFEQLRELKISAIPSLTLSEVFLQLLLSIGDDLRAVYSDLKQAISTLNLPVLFQYLLAILIVVIVCLDFSHLINFLSFTFLIIYIIWKFIYIIERHKKTWKQQYENAEMNRQQEVQQQQDLKSQVHQRQQELESNLYELEQQYAKYEQYLNQQKIKEQELTNRIREAYSDLMNLENKRSQQTENYQRKIEEIIEQERLSMVERLLCLEKLTQQWLDEDIDNLTERAKKELNLIDSKFIDEVGALQATPIRVLIGFTERTSSSLLVEDGVEGNTKNNEALNLHINPEEYKSEPSYDEKRRRYGVYEFLVIFLCSNFFSYYKCYFNFIRCQTVDEEYCEYLYDSIVSTKIQEKSSVNMKNNDDQKQVYSKRLIISTNDGKTICFRIAKSRGGNNLSRRLSQIDDAATEIRRMLRQRRIDYTVTDHSING